MNDREYLEAIVRNLRLDIVTAQEERLRLDARQEMAERYLAALERQLATESK